MTSPKISIIIPVYNVEPYIAECLQSVMQQTYTGEIECILVDDCGKDNSIAVAEKLIEDYTIENQKSKIENPISFRILHHEYNRGQAAARNSGVSVATGEYIYFLDSDDCITENCISILVEPLCKRPYDVIICGISFWGLNGRKFRNLIKKGTGPIDSKEEIFEEFYVNKTLGPHPVNRLIHKNLFANNDLKFEEGQIHEDELWTYKLLVATSTMYIDQTITYYYRIRLNSDMRTQHVSDRLVQSAYTTIDYILKHPVEVRKDIWNSIIAYYIGSYAATTCGNSEYKEQYKILRKRINYRPFKDWMSGKIKFQELKRHFHLLLPPSIGYMFIRWRYLFKKLHSHK